MAYITEFDVQESVYRAMNHMEWNDFKNAKFEINYILQQISDVQQTLMDNTVEKYVYNSLYRCLVEMAMKRYDNSYEIMKNTYDVVSLPQAL